MLLQQYQYKQAVAIAMTVHIRYLRRQVIRRHLLWVLVLLLLKYYHIRTVVIVIVIGLVIICWHFILSMWRIAGISFDLKSNIYGDWAKLYVYLENYGLIMVLTNNEEMLVIFWHDYLLHQVVVGLNWNAITKSSILECQEYSRWYNFIIILFIVKIIMFQICGNV